VDGVRWVATPYQPVPVPDSTLDYTCISYSWTSGLLQRWLDGGRALSRRTLPVLEATIRALRPRAIWLDAFCIPAAGPERASCLQSMGAIYGRATQSVAVLSEPCGAVLAQIRAGGSLDEAMLRRLENDAWVTRAWTYQEIANAKKIQFIAEGGTGEPVPGDDFLNAVGYALQQLKKARAKESFRLRDLGNVESLEDVLGEWMYTGPGERFAYQALAAMDRRRSTHPADYFNGMIGTLYSEPPSEPTDPAARQDACEHFMQVCEARGDFSFIYCAARRPTGPERRWRPLPGALRPLLAWHTYGRGQPGSLQSGRLHLERMSAVSRGGLGPEAREHIDSWLNSDRGGRPAVLSGASVLKRLRPGGIRACGQVTELKEGYFLPERRVGHGPEHEVVIADGVRWVHGAPGMLVKRAAGEGTAYEFCGTGVFVGRVPESGSAIDLV
jgi:hypothetical protein